MTSLERRTMLAVDFNVDDGVLEIDGDSNRNRISIYVDEDRTLVQIDNHRVRNIDTDDFRSIDINGAGGSDRIQVFGSNASISIKIVGGAGDDRIQVESSSNSSRALISGGAGEDSIRSGAGFNEMFGGDGDDSLYVTRGRATIVGGNGDDKLSAQGANKVSTTRMLRGNSGRDTLIGSDFNDHLLGDGGRDRLYGN
ncbi:MAG TPA: hypothetical protein PK402_11080, partial [Tepidisphaeraceae bacterium]|nr:hypothetical protein [Tepidisphaeraceae bacterium]